MIERLRLGWSAARLDGFRQRARQLVQRERPAIMAVAAALRRNGGTLSGDAVNAMLPIRQPEGRLCGRRNDPAQAID